MTDEFIKIDVQGIEKLIDSLEKYPREIKKYLQAAGKEAGSRVILPTEGLKKYPAATAANQPPTPYYIRGRGMQRAGRRKPAYNDMRSERFGTQWYVKNAESMSTEIGNRASYAQYVSGEEQARALEKIGWRKLLDVAQEKLTDITRVYQTWVDKLIKDLGL
jgi:hypothetical protein